MSRRVRYVCDCFRNVAHMYTRSNVLTRWCTTDVLRSTHNCVTRMRRDPVYTCHISTVAGCGVDADVMHVAEVSNRVVYVYDGCRIVAHVYTCAIVIAWWRTTDGREYSTRVI
jgi:hypothetical protein